MLIRTTAVLVFVLLLVIVPSAAQDATPTELPSETPLPTLTPTDIPTPIPTFTETPTASPTLVPTETATVMETPTATAAVTETPTETATADSFETASPSPTLIETPTETATSEPYTPSPLPTLTAMTLPGEPELGLLYADNFEVGDTFAWNLGVGWSLATYPQGQVLQLLSSDAFATLLSDPLNNVAAQVLFQLNTGNLFLGARDGYRAVVDTQGLVRLYRSGQELASAFVGAAPAGQWRTLRLSVMGDVLRVAVDGLAVITLQDPTPLPPGSVSMGGDSSSNFLVADFDLYIPMDELRERSQEKDVATAASDSALSASAEESGMSIMSFSGMSQIAFVSTRDFSNYLASSREIYTMNADGSNIQRLTNNTAGDEEPSWSFDDTLLVFETSRDGGLPEIYKMNADGSNPQRLTNNGVYDQSPVWSPDGSKIAFSSARNGYPSGIYVMNADGSNVQRLSPTNASEGYPAWSSDNQIAFTSTRDGNSEIYVMNADGSNARRLTNSTALDYIPDWSPSAGQIAFTSIGSSGWGHMYVMNADGSTIRPLMPDNTSYYDVGSSWSPDGSQIAFHTNRDSNIEIYKMCSGVTSPLIVARLTSNTADDFLLAWSHTGSVPALSGECPPPATPTPTPTPTPTATPNPDLTYYEQFKGIMFWAIYNETNSNQQHPFSEELPTANPDIDGSGRTIQSYDHRYVMARTILNNIPLNDISTGIGFMKQRWGGSIAKTDYTLWQYQTSGCTLNGNPIGTYAQANNNDAILRWFNGYAECLRDGQPLAGYEYQFEQSYQQIMTQIQSAIEDRVASAANPVPGMSYIKHTSTCFVWHRDPTTHQKTGCRGPNGKINMLDFCNQQPDRPSPPNNRNCRSSPNPTNPDNIVASDWLNSDEGKNSNQQMGLETTVERGYKVNLGYYTPDQPIQNSDGSYTSGIGCETNCYFVMGNPSPFDNLSRLFEIEDETDGQAWERHKERHNSPDYGYHADQTTYFVHVLRIETEGKQARTWITIAFQAN